MSSVPVAQGSSGSGGGSYGAVDVLQLLHVAYHGSKEERTSATAQLEAALNSPSAPHHLLTLLRAGLDMTLPAEQSLSALLYAKNCLLHTMSDEVLASTPGLLNEMESILFSGVFAVPEGHRKIACACVMSLVSSFQWNYLPQLLPMVGVNLASTSAEQSLGVLQLLYTYVKRFKTINLEPMPMKLEVCGGLVEALPLYFAYNDFRIAHYVFKVMECVVETVLQLNSVKAIPGNALEGWLAIMAHFPEEHYKAASAAGGKAYTEYVLCVKRIAMITFSVMNDATRRKKPAPVAAYFLKHHAERFMVVWRSWLQLCVGVSDRSTHKKSELFAIRFLKLCTLDETLYKQHLRPNALAVVEQLLFPYLCYGEEDEDVFADDDNLTEYVQYLMEEGISGGELTQRQAASNAILALIGGKKSFHDPSLLQELLEVLTKGLSLEDCPANYPRLFGFMNLLSILRKYLRAVPVIWSQQMALVLMRFVAPRVQASIPFCPLRCRAIVVCQRYCKVPMPTEDDLASFVGMICGLVQDPDARVRLAAIDTMCTLLEMKRARTYLLPVLVPLVEECISFLNRVQTTFVPTVILHLVTHFSPELSPVLGKLGHTLVQHFLATAFNLETQEDATALDDAALAQYESAAFSADALLDAIYTVVTSCSENAEALTSMRADVLRLVRHVLEQPDCFDFMDKTLSIFLHVVHFSHPITDDCWALLPLLFQSVESGIGVDFFNTIEEVLDNFVSGSTAAYLTNDALMEATFAACQKMLIGGVVCVSDCQVAAPQLIEAMLHQAKGAVDTPGLFDRHLPRFTNLLLQALLHRDIQNAELRVRVWVIAALMDCFYYDAAATVALLTQSNAFAPFLDAFFEFFRACWAPYLPAEAVATATLATPAGGKKPKKSKKRHGGAGGEDVTKELSILTRKVLILGLTSLLQCLAGPGSVQHPCHAMFVSTYLARTVALAQYCVLTNEALYESRCRISEANLEKLRLGIEEDVEDVDLNDEYEGDEAVLGVDGGDDTGGLLEGDDVAEDWDPEEEDDGNDDANPLGLELDEGDEYESPIDNVNEVAFFLQWASGIGQQSNPAVAANSMPVLKSEDTYAKAAQVAGRYRELCVELEKAMAEDYQKRSTAAAVASVGAAPSTF